MPNVKTLLADIGKLIRTPKDAAPYMPENLAEAAKILRKATEFAPMEQTVARATRNRNFGQLLQGHAKNKGHILVEKGKTPTEAQMIELGQRFGTKTEKVLTDAKVIAKPSKWKDLGKGLLLGGGLVAGAGGVTALGDMGATLSRDLFKGRAFEEMVKIHPKLAIRDQERVALFFESLWTFAPDLAKDPLVSGDIINRAMEMDISGGFPMESIKTVVEIQHKQRDVKGSPGIGGNLADFLSGAAKEQVVGVYK